VRRVPRTPTWLRYRVAGAAIAATSRERLVEKSVLSSGAIAPADTKRAPRVRIAITSLIRSRTRRDALSDVPF